MFHEQAHDMIHTCFGDRAQIRSKIGAPVIGADDDLIGREIGDIIPFAGEFFRGDAQNGFGIDRRNKNVLIDRRGGQRYWRTVRITRAFGFFDRRNSIAQPMFEVTSATPRLTNRYLALSKVPPATPGQSG